MTYQDGVWTRTDRPELLSDRLGYPAAVGDEAWAKARPAITTPGDVLAAAVREFINDPWTPQRVRDALAAYDTARDAPSDATPPDAGAPGFVDLAATVNAREPITVFGVVYVPRPEIPYGLISSPHEPSPEYTAKLKAAVDALPKGHGTWLDAPAGRDTPVQMHDWIPSGFAGEHCSLCGIWVVPGSLCGIWVVPGVPPVCTGTPTTEPETPR